MRIGILGTGSVGSALGTGLADAGHTVVLGSRTPAQPRLALWAEKDPEHRRVGTYRDAATFGEIVILAVPGRVLAETLDTAVRDSFAESIVIDVTNPIAYTSDGVVNAYGEEDSGAEFVQRELPDVPVVKAFNQINPADMTHPERSSTTVLRIAGDNEAAKATVAGLAESFGWEVRDLGPLEKSRAIENGVVNWVRRAQEARGSSS